MLVKSASVFLSIFLIGLIPSVFASQAVSMMPLDVSSTHGQPAQFTIIVYEPAEGGSVDILIWSPSSPYSPEDVNRVSVQSPKGNVALGIDPNDSTLLIGKVDTFTGSEGYLEIPVFITIASGAPAGEYGVSVNSVLPNGNTNGFANGVLRITGATQPPTTPQPPPPEPNPVPEQPDGTPQIVGINMSTDYDKSKKYHAGDSLSIEWLTAKNFGDAAGTRTIELTVTHSSLGKSKTDVLLSHDVTLFPGEVSSYPGMTYTFEKTGTYQFNWDDQTQMVTIVAKEDDPRDQPVTTVGRPNIYGKSMALDDLGTKFNVGKKITITSVSAQNAGDVTGTKTIPFELTVSSQGNSKKQTLFSEKFTLGAGKSELRVVNYELELNEPGSYVLEWGPQTHMFQVVQTDDPRDEPISGAADIRGYIAIHWMAHDFVNPRMSVNEEIVFLLLAHNLGDATGSKTLEFKATYLESKNPAKTLHTEKFTLKPDQHATTVVHYVPKEPGRYLFEWGESSRIIVISNIAKKDPRDAQIEGMADIRGAGFGWNAYVDTSGKSYNGEEFRFKISAENYGDELGMREMPFTVTITNDGNSVTKVLKVEYLLLWPQEQFNDIITFYPEGPGQYVFDWDGYTAGFEIEKTSDDPRDAPISGQADIRASGFSWKAPLDPSSTAYGGEIFQFEIAAENYGDAAGSRDIPFTVTITNGATSKTETLRIKRVVLEPGEMFIDNVSFHPTGPGQYVFDWDGYTTGFEIGDNDPRDAPTEEQSNIRAQSINVLDNNDPKNHRFTPWDELRIEAGALNIGDAIGTRDIDLLVERHYDGKLKEKYRLDTLQFTLKPEEYSAKTVLFTPQEIGEYHILWGELSHKFTVHSESTSDDPRDASGGISDIRGLAFRYTQEDGTAPLFYPDERIYFYVSAKNFGDATGTKKMGLDITNLEDGSTETPYSKTFTLKSGEQQSNDKTISYTPTKTGTYLLKWGEFSEIITIKDRGDDPRDSKVGGKPDIRGRWLHASMSSGFFDVQANAANYGDESGEKTLAIKMTNFIGGKAKTETIHSQAFSLKPGENQDTESIMFPIDTGGLHIFEFDDKTSIVYVSAQTKNGIQGINVSVDNSKESNKPLAINLDTMNFGTNKETRTLELKLIRVYQGEQDTKTIYQKTFSLEPGEQDSTSITHEISKPGLYVFVWDASTATLRISDANITHDETRPQTGCLIATATFGSELAPQVQLLREIRDGTLYNTSTGTAFMAGFNEFYYAFSPGVADLERQNPIFREIVKTAITPMLSTLSILQFVDIDSDQEMLGYGIGIILLNIGMYFVAPAIIIIKVHSRIQNYKK